MIKRALIWAALVAFLLDQVSKYVVIHAMELSRVLSIDVFPPFLNFRYGENRGINFGLFNTDSNDMRWILIGVSIVVVVAVIIWVTRARAKLWVQVSAGLLVGGALGNVFDRFVYGYVLDFLNMSCCGFTNPYSFNVADVFIFAGAFGLILLDDSAKKKSA